MQAGDNEASILLAQLRAFLLPGGEDAARLIRCVRLKEQGEMRPAPDARWISFAAEERIDALRSGFAWEARFRTARVVPMVVVDAYEDGRGRLVAKVGGAVPLVNSHGPDCDKAELQRYLSGIAICPPMLVANPTLVCTAVAARVLRLRDSRDPTDAAVDHEVGEGGLPICARAERPRLVGKRAITTQWSATGREFREWDGICVATHLEAAWHLPEETFVYYRVEVMSFTVER